MPTRREVLKQLSVGGAGFVVSGRVLRGQGTPLLVNNAPVEIGVAAVSPATLRFTVAPVVNGVAASIPVDGALDPARAFGPSPARVARTETRLTLGNLLVQFQPAGAPTFTITTRAGQPIQEIALSATTGAVTFRLPKGPLLGMGEGGAQFDRRGNVDRMRSGQGGYQLQTHGGRVPIQWLVGTDGWGLFVHQPLGTFDLSGDRGVFTPTDPTIPLDLFLVVSNDPLVLMSEYAAITGRAELPARWTFGYMQSHRTLAGPDDVLAVAKTMREKRLPCDALIYLGTDFTPSGWNTHNGEYTWNPANFPDPKGMISELHAQHFKVVLHTVIEGQRLTGAVSEPCRADMIPPGRTPDGRWPPDRSVPCYWPSHKPLYDIGIDGWWPDQGDGYDASSRLARIRMYWEGSQQWRPNERPFALHRNGYAGMQRYGAFLWSGDVYSRWETLKTHVPNAVNTGLSGIPFWGTDIGGFVPTADYTGELHVRWFQFGAFCPLFRAHGRDWRLRLPWGWNTGTVGVSEVANYTGGAMDPPESELHNADVEPICRKYLELRYQLLPYLYSAARECTQTGLPIIRAMWLHYPGDAIAVARGDQYMWGRDMLIAPVVEKGAASRRVYLPAGTWFDYWTNARVTGGREIDRPVDLATMPIYVRAGAIIPTEPVRQHTDDRGDGAIMLTIYPGSNGAALVYEDDGKTFDYRQGAWMGLSASWNDAGRQLTLTLAPGSRLRDPAPRRIDVRLAGSDAVIPATFSGRPMTLRV